MLAVALKVLLAVFACAVAILGVSDVRTITSYDSEEPKPWFKRLTAIGYVKIACAIATLLLIGANELLSYRSGVAARAKADDDSKILQDKLAEARQTITANIQQVQKLARTNRHLVTTLDSSLILAGIARVPPNEIDRRFLLLKFEGGADLIPKSGDMFEWSFACQGGRPPSIPSSQQDVSCSQTAYGRLMANSYPILLSEQSGRRPFFGTLSTGEQMSYRSAAEGGFCPQLAAQLKELHCQLEITVMRQARWKFLEMQAKETEDSSIPDEAEEACRRYEALYGESCASALKK